jgi:hypothetical protein
VEGQKKAKEVLKEHQKYVHIEKRGNTPFEANKRDLGALEGV